MKLRVCVVEDPNCMFHLCTECPDKTELSSTLMTRMNEFIDIFTDEIFELCDHHFINVQQAAYLNEAKAALDNQTFIILMDFS